ncbi:MAG TPA: hypothetical protein VE733_19935 [Streptosporangiaceae bacterium]|nr:hypothetical protein [Streptosporangiaceae bacterium]
MISVTAEDATAVEREQTFGAVAEIALTARHRRTNRANPGVSRVWISTTRL